MNLAQSFIPETEEAGDDSRRRGTEVHALAYEMSRGPWRAAPVVVPRALFREGSTQSRVYDVLNALSAGETVTPDDVLGRLSDAALTRTHVCVALSDLVGRHLAVSSGHMRSRRYGRGAAFIEETAKESEEEDV